MPIFFPRIVSRIEYVDSSDLYHEHCGT
jgi:hypothetical protein